MSIKYINILKSIEILEIRLKSNRNDKKQFSNIFYNYGCNCTLIFHPPYVFNIQV